MRVRMARPYDLGLFRRLWTEYLVESEKQGSMVLANYGNLELFEKMFNDYTTGKKRGVVLFHAHDAVLMWGEGNGSMFSLTLGDVAEAWGGYVSPEKRGLGIGGEMYKVAVKRLRKMGFDHIGGLVQSNMSAVATAGSAGFKPSGQLYLISLKEN